MSAAPYHLIEFAELDSTNRHACAHLHELADRDVIQAAVQTAGRGRMDRRWISDVPGNLCLSLILKPQQVPSELPLANLSQLLALSACVVLDSLGAPATIKWPNDIQVRGRKIAGILAETVVRGNAFQGVVLGIGVNLNLDRTALATIDQPATSLAAELGHAVNVARFRDALLTEFFARYERFLQAGFGLIREAFLQRCPFLGQSVEIRSMGQTLRGTACSITDDGALKLLDASGLVHTVSIGEMFAASRTSP